MFTVLLVLILLVITSLSVVVRRRKLTAKQDPLKQFEGPKHYPILGHCIPTRWKGAPKSTHLVEKSFCYYGDLKAYISISWLPFDPHLSPKKDLDQIRIQAFLKNLILRTLKLEKTFNELISEWFPKYPSPCTFYLPLRTPVVLIYDPENFQIVANKTLEKGVDYKYIERFYGNGIATINDIETWKKRRRLLLPSISLKLMGSYYLNEYNKLNAEFVKELEVYADTSTQIDIWPLVHHAICSIYFASFIKFDKRDQEDIELSKLAHAVPSGLKFLLDRTFFPWLYHDLASKIGEWVTGKRHDFQKFDSSKKKIFEKLKTRMLRTNENISPKTDEEPKVKRNFIETLSSKEGLELYSSKEFMEEIMTFFIAATETTAVNISFTMLMLAIHEDSQEKVFQEICQVIGEKERTITMEDLNQLVYLDQCINETFRLFPSIPWIARRTTKDVILKDGRFLPAGCDVLLAIIGIHRSPAIYENPTVWKPERFLPEEVAKRHPCSFVPFSIGARNCLAAKIGVLSIKSQIVSLIQTYKFTTTMKLSDVESNLNFDVDLRNEAGFHMRLQKRHS